MDPITTAILATLPALASDMIKSSVKDAYQGLKSVILRKSGANSLVVKSVEDLEANPKSQVQATILADNIVAEKLTSDTEVMQALAKLVDALKTERILAGDRSSEGRNSYVGGPPEIEIVRNEDYKPPKKWS